MIEDPIPPGGGGGVNWFEETSGSGRLLFLFTGGWFRFGCGWLGCRGSRSFTGFFADHNRSGFAFAVLHVQDLRILGRFGRLRDVAVLCGWFQLEFGVNEGRRFIGLLIRGEIDGRVSSWSIMSNVGVLL